MSRRRYYRDPDDLHDAVANGDRDPPPGWGYRNRVLPPPGVPCGHPDNPHVVRSAGDRTCSRCGGVLPGPWRQPSTAVDKPAGTDGDDTR